MIINIGFDLRVSFLEKLETQLHQNLSKMHF